ncbi:MAG TPA: phage holin family protein [Herbaspirillum sp.]|jgi:uncharacterized membrane protein YqjE
MSDSPLPHLPSAGARTTPVPHPNLIAGLAGIGKNALGLMFNRFELAAFELAEARVHLLRLIVVGALALTAVWFAIAYWSVLIVLVNWDALGWKVLAMMAGLFSILAIALGWYARVLMRDDKLAMPETSSELRKDRDALLS